MSKYAQSSMKSSEDGKRDLAENPWMEELGGLAAVHGVLKFGQTDDLLSLILSCALEKMATSPSVLA